MHLVKAMLPSTSNLNRRKDKKLKVAPKPTRDWLEIPSDVMANILQRIGVVEILENAQTVCTTWRQICKEVCKDPAIWRVIYVDRPLYPRFRQIREETCKRAVDQSQGQLVDLSIVDSHDWDILTYVTDRSSQLRRLQLANCNGHQIECWSQVVKKFSFLVELSLYNTAITLRAIEKAERYCPMLRILKVNQKPDAYRNEEYIEDDQAVAIGESLPELTHLELVGNNMSNYGLKTILDGCSHLELLDLRACFYIKLTGAIRKRCLQIKCLKRPRDSLQDCPYIYDRYGDSNWLF